MPRWPLQDLDKWVIGEDWFPRKPMFRISVPFFFENQYPGSFKNTTVVGILNYL
jgi:hypothetical protein